MTPADIAKVIRAERDTYADPEEPDFFANGAAFNALEALAHRFAHDLFNPPRLVAADDDAEARKREFVDTCGFDYDPEEHP